MALKDIVRYKTVANNMDKTPYLNLAGILQLFKKDDGRYSNFRFLILYDRAKRKLLIDERTMSRSDFDQVLAKVKSSKYSLNHH